MSYSTAVAALYKLGHELVHTPSHKFDLAHVRVLLEALDNPQTRFRSVLIAGTNGKGSTAATLSSILQAAGHKTALYTSPHLVRVNERICVNGEPISDMDFTAVYSEVEAKSQELIADSRIPWHPSFFEMLTAMAFQHFATTGVEIAVLEVGMGGRLDATNVVEPIVSVITDISLDHQKFLGNTIAEITHEKAGIIHEGGVVVTLPQHPEANEVIGHAAIERHARAYNAVAYMPPVTPESDAVWAASSRNRYPLTFMGEQIAVDSPLLGRHQLRNIALAIAAAEQVNNAGIHITTQAIESGIRNTRWPGRFQIIPASERLPEIVLDVAHNPDGAWALRSAVSERYEGRPITLLFAVLHDKAVSEVVKILFPVADCVIVTPVANPRTASSEEIAAAAEITGTAVFQTANFSEAIQKALAATAKNGLLLITGSIYLVGEALGWLESRDCEKQ